MQIIIKQITIKTINAYFLIVSGYILWDFVVIISHFRGNFRDEVYLNAGMLSSYFFPINHKLRWIFSTDCLSDMLIFRGF